MNIEYRLGKAAFIEDGGDVSLTADLGISKGRSPRFDLDLTYVECRFCGKPILWGQGKTSLLLHASGIDVALLDEECMILSEGCAACQPENDSFQLHVVRVASFSPQEFLLLQENRGTA